MKTKAILMFAFLLLAAFGAQTVLAQFPISIPKITKTPKIKSDDYDKQAFTEIVYSNHNTDSIDPYLECYAKKHNLELIKVTGDAFHERYFHSDFKKTLQDEQTKLGEIEAQLKSKLKSRPDTGLSYMENPAIWEEITVNRAEYLQCALGAKDANKAKESVWLQRHLAEIAKRQKELEDSTPGSNWLLQDNADHFLFKAVSQSARNKWLTESNAMDFKQYVDPPLDSLAATAAKKLPYYLPDTKKYPIHNPAEENMIKGKINDITNVKIFYVGLETASWLIDKNDLGIPIARYKHGMVWARRTTNDQPYCITYFINVIQDYAGGGTYGSSYGNFIDYELVGCPAAK